MYSKLALKKMVATKGLNIEEQIQFNILNFIHMIHLNKQDFIEESFGSEYFGELPMTFKKKAGQVVGIITVKIKGEERKYIFNDQGYEALHSLLEL
jgi:hypothetical protein